VPAPARIPVLLTHPRTGRRYRLVPLDTLAPELAVLERLVAVCNEPELFRWLFAARCGDRPYGPEDARGWLAWGAAGWRAGGPCAFVALDEEGLPAAACDLQSADAEPEIGYWCGAAHLGLGTPMVEALAGLARLAGCRGLRARVRPGNTRSEALLRRCGFACSGAGADGSSLWHRPLGGA
jgi:RimJ/RimL family protein N-acetyltransferase